MTLALAWAGGVGSPREARADGGPTGELSDGLLEASLPEANADLLLRARDERDGESSGYLVKLRRDAVTVERSDRGRATRLASFPLVDVDPDEFMRLRVGAIGPHLAIELHQGGELRLAGTVSDSAYRAGWARLELPLDGATLEVLDCVDGVSHVLDVSAHYHAIVDGVRAAGDRGWLPDDEVAVRRAPLEELLVAACGGERLYSLTVEHPRRLVRQAFAAIETPDAERTTPVLHDRYKTFPDIERLLQAFHLRHPRDTRVVRLANTHGDQAVMAMALSRDIDTSDHKPSMLIDSAIHGDELLTVEIALDAIRQLLEPDDTPERPHRWLDDVVMWVVPMANPDGIRADLVEGLKGRKNGRDANGDGVRGRKEGVDLNRNFPLYWGEKKRGSSPVPESRVYRGPGPASEPETQALMRLAVSEHFAGAIAYHDGTVGVFGTYTIPGLNRPRPDVGWKLAKAMAGAMPDLWTGHHFWARKVLYNVDGTEKDWLRHTFGTQAFVIEASHYIPTNSRDCYQAVGANRAAWQVMLGSFVEGPGVSGFVRNEAGHPVVARVTVDEVRLRSREVWTTRCRDGRFDYYLTEPGVYHVRVRAAGGREVVREVTVDERRVTVDITVPGDADTRPECPSVTRSPALPSEARARR